jgi:hypothetical protein
MAALERSWRISNNRSQASAAASLRIQGRIRDINRRGGDEIEQVGSGKRQALDRRNAARGGIGVGRNDDGG